MNGQQVSLTAHQGWWVLHHKGDFLIPTDLLLQRGNKCSEATSPLRHPTANLCPQQPPLNKVSVSTMGIRDGQPGSVPEVTAELCPHGVATLMWQMRVLLQNTRSMPPTYKLATFCLLDAVQHDVLSFTGD